MREVDFTFKVDVGSDRTLMILVESHSFEPDSFGGSVRSFADNNNYPSVLRNLYLNFIYATIYLEKPASRLSYACLVYDVQRASLPRFCFLQKSFR